MRLNTASSKTYGEKRVMGLKMNAMDTIVLFQLRPARPVNTEWRATKLMMQEHARTSFLLLSDTPRLPGARVPRVDAVVIVWRLEVEVGTRGSNTEITHPSTPSSPRQWVIPIHIPLSSAPQTTIPGFGFK